MLTPHFLAKAARVVLLAGSGAALFMMLGPFQGAEAVVGVDDKTAHASVFGGLLALAYLSYPNLRRADMAITAGAMAGLIELAQLLTARTGSLGDWLAGAAGVLLVYGLGQIETLRQQAREHGGVPFATLRANDRRRVRTQFLGVSLPRQKAPAVKTEA